jgi:hypothetical protein
MSRNQAECRMVGQLRDERECVNAGESAAEDAQIEGRDREAGEGAAARVPDPDLVEHNRPPQREREMNRDGRGEKPRRPRLPREHDRAGGECCLERVAPRRECVRRGRDPTEGGGGQGGAEDAQGPKDTLGP